MADSVVVKTSQWRIGSAWHVEQQYVYCFLLTEVSEGARHKRRPLFAAVTEWRRGEPTRQRNHKCREVQLHVQISRRSRVYKSHKGRDYLACAQAHATAVPRCSHQDQSMAQRTNCSSNDHIARLPTEICLDAFHYPCTQHCMTHLASAEQARGQEA